MSLNSVLTMLLGAALIAIGVLASALADRIRNREAPPRDRVSRVSRVQSAQTAIPVAAPTALHPTAISGAAPTPLHSAAISGPAPTALHPTPSATVRPSRSSRPVAEGGEDVVAALVAAGYKKAIATEATWACSVAERGTLEGWTASALRRCVRGGMS